jgi:hypothetical protein
MKVIKCTYIDKASGGDCLIVFDCVEAESSNCSRASEKQSATLAPSRGLAIRVEGGGGERGRE